jgi:hypothetical protein
MLLALPNNGRCLQSHRLATGLYTTILSTHLRLGLPSGLFPSVFSTVSYIHSSSAQIVLQFQTSNIESHSCLAFQETTWHVLGRPQRLLTNHLIYASVPQRNGTLSSQTARHGVAVPDLRGRANQVRSKYEHAGSIFCCLLSQYHSSFSVEWWDTW